MIDATISLLLPAKDEGPNIRSVLDDAVRELPRYFRDYEVLVVDDGSRDGTASVVRAAALEHSRIQLLQHPVNRGHGDAVRTGLAAARGDYVLLMDADGQLCVEDVARFTPHIAPDVAVLGYRPARADSTYRKLLARTFRLVVRLAFGIVARDPDLSFKLFWREAVDPQQLLGRFAIVNVELLLHLRAHGVRSVEVPVRHVPRAYGTQTGGSLRVATRTIPEFVRLWWRVHVRGAARITTRLATVSAQAPDGSP